MGIPRSDPVVGRHRRQHIRNYDRRLRGESYAASAYDGLIAAALRHVAASAVLVAATMPKALAGPTHEIDASAAARIKRERDVAAARYIRDRDIAALQAAMSRLDADERSAGERAFVEVTPEQARRYLMNPAQLWEETEPEGRRAIAEAIFNRIDAIGLDLVIHPSAEAERYGWAEAFGPDPIVCSIGQSGRGERI